ncbi:MAG: hypothetical protein IK134_06830 [Oscillospiraceae bacterium]|nr:hypothetical protein [Oscillospiraceae bacterium]
MGRKIAKKIVRKVGRKVVRRVTEEVTERIVEKGVDTIFRQGSRVLRRHTAGKLIRRII